MLIRSDDFMSNDKRNDKRNDKCRCGSNKKYKKCCLSIDENAQRLKYKSVCMLIGNGFTIDFIKNFSDIRTLNPSNPLQTFSNKEINYDWFIDKVPAIKKDLISKTFDDDFKAISVFIEKSKGNDEKDCQLRRFIAMSYSLLQYKLDDLTDSISKWQWAKWLYANRSKLSCLVSFNYDLLTERVMEVIGIPYRRTGTSSEKVGLPIIKPHGSIDFDLKGLIWTDNIWTITTSFNQKNGQVDVIPKGEWLNPRVEADIIPPSQVNYQRHLQWVEEGYKAYKEITKDLEAFIVMGFRYSEEDRKEFNELVESLPKGKKLDFYIVNPEPPEALKQFLISQGHNVFEVLEGLPW